MSTISLPFKFELNFVPSYSLFLLSPQWCNCHSFSFIFLPMNKWKILENFLNSKQLLRLCRVKSYALEFFFLLFMFLLWKKFWCVVNDEIETRIHIWWPHNPTHTSFFRRHKKFLTFFLLKYSARKTTNKSVINQQN